GTNRNGQKYVLEQLRDYRKRVRELRFAITRAKDADTVMKRSRGDLERAIKAGVLELDADVLQNPQEYVRTEKNILLHKGSHYRAIIDENHNTTAIVRVTAIDAERGGCTCRISWLDVASRYSRSPGTALFLPFNLIIESVTFEEGVAESRETAARGVQCHQLSTTLTRDQFYDAIRNGVMNVTAGKPGRVWGGGSAIKYWAYRTDDGQIALSSAYDGVIGQKIGRASDIAPERWIYPDGNDEALKREVAKIQASDNPLNVVDGEGFLQALYGYDYIQGMQAWGAQATMDDVSQEFENWMAGRGLSGRSLNKVTSEDILSLFRKPSGEGLESFWKTVVAYRLFQGRMKAFSNTDDIERMFNQVKAAKITAKIEKTRAALVAWRDALFEQYKSLSDADVWSALEQLANNGVDGAKLAIVQADNPLDSPAAQWIKVGAVIN
ncbi:helicase SNF2, partial [Escherichia coli]|nr:helicase SNF2 [Escherichia coli]